MTIGDRVRLLRKEKGMTQSELAQKLGYKSKTSVAHIENGRDIPRSQIVQLADILGTTPSYLMGWEVPPELQPYKMPPEPNRDPNAAYKMPDGSTEHGGADEKKPALARLTKSELNNRIESLEEQDLDKLIDFIKIMESDGESKEDLSLFIEFVKWKDKKDRP